MAETNAEALQATRAFHEIEQVRLKAFKAESAAAKQKAIEAQGGTPTAPPTQKSN